jgi:ribose transport system ATP-binding protein
MAEPLLRAENITKRFPGVLALDRVSFDLRRGEVHVLFGENGAGKSTVIKILCGAYVPEEGDVYVGGKKVTFRSPLDARLCGISAVYQEFSLVPQLTVAENFFLGRELVKAGFLDTRSMLKSAKVPLEDLGFDIDPRVKVGDLSRSERQMVEIAKAFQQRMSVLILDEPSASVTDKEVSRLFEIIKRLTNDGVGVVYISHRIDELQRIGDRITVLRDGKKVATRDMSDVDEHTLISMMTGREYTDIFPAISNNVGETVLSVENLSTAGGLQDVSFEVRAGEILGIAGLIGGGKSLVGRAIFGLERITRGQIKLFDQVLEDIKPSRSLKRGIIYFPADRHKEGLVLCRSVKENQTLASVPFFERMGFIDVKREEATVEKVVKRMNIRTPGIDTTINHLSGGNQQKVMLSRGLNQEIRIFIFDEASCGIDVAAKHDVYVFLKERAEQGAAVIFISSELPEILHLSHRVMVMHRGTISTIMSGSEATEERILSACFGYDHMRLANASGERSEEGGTRAFSDN